MTRPLYDKALGSRRPGAGALVLFCCLAVAAGLTVFDHDIHHRGWPLVAGLVFGVLLQRGELSFVRAWRDLLALRDATQLMGFVLALVVAVPLVLMTLESGPLAPPPGARIAPVAWTLPVAAFAFGVGSVIARGSLMVHLRRLGEGALVAVPALLATFVGFIAAMASWPSLYERTIGPSPALWLPASIGVFPTLALELGLLAIAVALLWRRLPPSSGHCASRRERVFVDPWSALVVGPLVGLLAAACYAMGEPLGLTGECAAMARAAATWLGLVPVVMPGLDEGIGGIVAPLRGPSFSGHVVIVSGVILGAFAAALASGRFAVSAMTAREAAEMAVGGLLIGWGGMTALGTVTGAIISGIAVGAVSGWVFLVFASAGIVVALTLDRRPMAAHSGAAAES